MNLDLNLIPTIWYENADGERFVPDLMLAVIDVPPGFIYQHSQFPMTLVHTILVCEDGQSSQLMRGEMGWSEDLVLAMANTGKWQLSTAILIAANGCERCVNALAHQHGCSWGYPEYSDAWHRSRTRCCFCKHEAKQPSFGMPS